MPDSLQPFHDLPLDAALLAALRAEHRDLVLPRLRRLWMYYRNALADPAANGGSSGAPAQFHGLPVRLRGDSGRAGRFRDDRLDREIVIENDIAWRVQTLVDFMFPAAPTIVSRAPDRGRRAVIEDVLSAVFRANGDVRLWQDAALLGSIYGHVDFLLRPDALATPGASPEAIVIEAVEPPRAIPLLNPRDFTRLDAFILVMEQPDHGARRRTSRRRRILPWDRTPLVRNHVDVVEIYSARHRQRYENDELVESSPNRLGVLPVVHVQNLSQPLEYAGVSDVEPLIPLQDELNTRISDRANRVTLQSFRMWLGKGIEGFANRPVGPGQMWVTDNLDASIEAFGGDANSPSERQHIEELREAIDKASGVTPAAAGHIRARVGNLTSENALRISLMGTIAKVKRKRVTYGAGVQALCRLILHALHVYGVFESTPDERSVDLVWSDPLPVDESRKLADARVKAELGVPLDTLRAELGYPDDDPRSVPSSPQGELHVRPDSA